MKTVVSFLIAIALLGCGQVEQPIRAMKKDEGLGSSLKGLLRGEIKSISCDVREGIFHKYYLCHTELTNHSDVFAHEITALEGISLSPMISQDFKFQ